MVESAISLDSSGTYIQYMWFQEKKTTANIQYMPDSYWYVACIIPINTKLKVYRSCLMSQKLVFHQSKCICAIKRILSTTPMYVSSSSFMYLRFPCYCDACLNSSVLRVGLKTLLNIIYIKISRPVLKGIRTILSLLLLIRAVMPVGSVSQINCCVWNRMPKLTLLITLG